ncbi:MAG: hypothetical protein JW714_00990 [Candidatus Omnitrophica bacterium]|nr:hypothetical protein [Candidatus Omnitrophota bacterium]
MSIYDFGIGWPIPREEDDLFVNTLEAECSARKLSFIFVDGSSLKKLSSAVKKGELKIKFYLDMASETYDSEDKFTRFAYRLKDSGARIVADPDDVKAAADKSITHFDLVAAKIPVPFTVVVRHWERTRRLSAEEKKGLGRPFVIKPASGYGQQGVKIINQKPKLKDIAEARKFDEGDNFLLQEYVEPQALEGRPAWFRVYHLFGEIIPCWWDPGTHIFRQVTLKEMDTYKLSPLIQISSEIARITLIDWFSCEIAINKKTGKFVVIDYMNDQCAIYPQSQHKDGVPDDLVIHIAGRIVEKAWQYVKGRFSLRYRAVWFPKVKVKEENA